MPLAPSQFANTQWKLPGFNMASGGTPGVSLNYRPQQQTIGDPRNQAVLDAARAGTQLAAPAAAPAAASRLTDRDARLLAQLRHERDVAKWEQFSGGSSVGMPRLNLGPSNTLRFLDKLRG